MSTKQIGKMKIEYEYINESDLDSITLDEDGEFVYAEDPVFWSEFKFKINDDAEFKLISQFDCGNGWRWYNGGGDGEDSSYTAEHYFSSDSIELIDFLDNLLSLSMPSLNVSLSEKADYLRTYEDDNEELIVAAKKTHEICPEKSTDWALVTAFYYNKSIESTGDWECAMQIRSGLSKAQTLALLDLYRS